jgi:hypothetical protein
LSVFACVCVCVCSVLCVRVCMYVVCACMLQENLLSSSVHDDEFGEVIAKLPARYCVSMLRSQKELAMEVIRHREECSTADVDQAAIQVAVAKFNFFKKGLLADWDTAQNIRGSLSLLADEQHVWEQEWLSAQEKVADEVVKSHMDRSLGMLVGATLNTMKQDMLAYISNVEKLHNLGRDKVYVIVLYDLNSPHGRAKTRVKQVASLASTAMGQSPKRSMSVLFLSDIASKAAKGVQDDDNTLVDECTGESINVDTRFAMWTERRAGDETGDELCIIDGALPGCHFGRLGFLSKTATSAKEHDIMTKSKLALRRRPDRVVSLPPFRAMFHSESLNADSDLLSRERQTTSLEQLAAQKGIEFTQILMETLVDGLALGRADALIWIDLSPGLGCNALAARAMQVKMSQTNMYYLGCNTDQKDAAFAVGRITQALAKDSWEPVWRFVQQMLFL